MMNTMAVQGDSAISVLYIEDNRLNLTLVKKILEKKTAYRFLSALDPESGIACAHRERPDLILLDIYLPGMGGYEVKKRLQENPVTRAIPVIAISADAAQEEKQHARQAGFADYLEKPLDLVYFLDVIHRTLKTS